MVVRGGSWHALTPGSRAGGGTGAGNDERKGHGIGNACRAWVGGIGMDAAISARVHVEAGVAHSFSQSYEHRHERSSAQLLELTVSRRVYPDDSLHHAAKCRMDI